MTRINLALNQSHIDTRMAEALQQRHAAPTAILTMPARVSIYASIPTGIVRVLLAPSVSIYKERWEARCASIKLHKQAVHGRTRNSTRRGRGLNSTRHDATNATHEKIPGATPGQDDLVVLQA